MCSQFTSMARMQSWSVRYSFSHWIMKLWEEALNNVYQISLNITCKSSFVQSYLWVVSCESQTSHQKLKSIVYSIFVCLSMQLVYLNCTGVAHTFCHPVAQHPTFLLLMHPSIAQRWLCWEQHMFSSARGRKKGGVYFENQRRINDISWDCGSIQIFEDMPLGN